MYLGMIFLSVFVSIALPIERAMGYFRGVAIVMAILMLSSISGITFFLAERGFYPHKAICEEDPNKPD